MTTATLKAAMRRRTLARRGTLDAKELAAAARGLTDVVLAVEEVGAARCVASYVSIGREPGTRRLLDLLAARGVLVLVPILLADGDLDWAEYDSSDALEPASRGLLEPTGPRLGVDAVARADVVLAPALAVDRSGGRLGRGGGSYDRALARVRANALVLALLHDGELLPPREHVPVEPHDVRVAAAAEPIGLTRLR
jgi:5-formyltetrahydrofolate cyclo-ligase